MTRRIAIPLFGDEVAPRFCFADEFLVVDIQDGAAAASQRLPMADLPWPQRIAELAAAGVEVLLCGGFNRRFQPLAESHQITVIWGLYGQADGLIAAYCGGELEGQKLPAGRGERGRGRRQAGRRGCSRRE